MSAHEWQADAKKRGGRRSGLRRLVLLLAAATLELLWPHTSIHDTAKRLAVMLPEVCPEQTLWWRVGRAQQTASIRQAWVANVAGKKMGEL